ncbi:MAG: hypothetical protein JWN89_129 [Parcubacteria group bacterium]|nr:hypothetical protein [Parcubacteria group bacterium]
MQTQENPVYQFYSVLCGMFQYESFTPHNAEMLMKFYEEAGGRVTLPNVTSENIELWFHQFKDHSAPGNDPGARRMREIVLACIRDLRQIRGRPSVDNLIVKWQRITGLSPE